MSMSIATQEAIRSFDQAKVMLVAKSLQVPMQTAQDQVNFVTLAGLGGIAAGLWNLSYEVASLSTEVAEVKRLLQQITQQQQQRR